MSTEPSIIITPAIETAVVSSTEGARQVRDELLVLAGQCTAVADEIDAADAAATLKRLKTFVNTIETQREVAKAPSLAIGRSIDTLAKELSSKVLAEYDRIARVLGAFEFEQRRKREDERRKAEAESVRIADEARRKADQLRAQSQEPESIKQAEAIEEKATNQIIERKQEAANVARKAPGTRITEVIEFEVLDISELYRSNPTLCLVEPNKAAITAIIRGNPNIQIPGLRHWKTAKAGAR